MTRVRVSELYIQIYNIITKYEMYFMVAHLSVLQISPVINIRDEDLIKAFGVRVRKLRKERGYTMEKFAEIAGIDYRQLSYIELGEVNITISSINALAKGFKITISELMELNGY